MSTTQMCELCQRPQQPFCRTREVELARILQAGTLTQEEIRHAVRNPHWQRFRTALHGLDTKTKIHWLWLWGEQHQWDRAAQVQTMNYVNALRRGGQIKQ